MSLNLQILLWKNPGEPAATQIPSSQNFDRNDALSAKAAVTGLNRQWRFERAGTTTLKGNAGPARTGEVQRVGLDRVRDCRSADHRRCRGHRPPVASRVEPRSNPEEE